MYQTHYGFTRMPFTKDLPPNDLFAPAALQELASRLTFLTRERGLGLLTGEIGSGKSTAVRRFAASLDPNQFLVVYLPNPTIGISGLYRDLLISLAYEPPHSRPKMVARIRSAFQDLLQNKHRCPVIIIDEAHHLPPDAFEQLRLLFSTEMDSQSLGALLLVGHPELRNTLRLSIHQSFAQRISTRYHLSPLDLQATLAYIQHQFTIAGYKGPDIFTDDAKHHIFSFTKGIPRQINLVCHFALLSGMIDKHSIIELSTIRKVIADLEAN
jgi:type II secretory pathway predicted ATPase ExeA